MTMPCSGTQSMSDCTSPRLAAATPSRLTCSRRTAAAARAAMKSFSICGRNCRKWCALAPELRLLDGDDGLGVVVELVQVLADAVALAAGVGPLREALVHHGAVGLDAAGAGLDAQQIGAQLVGTALLVDGRDVADLVRYAV